jgi:hypothetical protein
MFVASLDASYLGGVVSSSPLFVIVAGAVGLTALFFGLRYYRPVLKSDSAKTGLALVAISIVVYTSGSFLDSGPLHWFALLGVYLGLGVTVGGKSLALPLAPALLTLAVLPLPESFPGPIGVLTFGLVTVSVAAFAFFRSGTKPREAPCVYCAPEAVSGYDSCSFCGRWTGAQAVGLRKSSLAVLAALSLVLILLTGISVPVINATTTGFEYSSASLAGVSVGVPLYSGPPLVLVNQSSDFYPGLGTAYLDSLSAPNGSVTVWVIGSASSPSTSQLSVILPGFGLNSTRTASNTGAPVYAWTYRSQPYLGYLGGGPVLPVGEGAPGVKHISFVVGTESPAGSQEGLPLALQTAGLMSSHLSEAQKFDFWLGLALIPSWFATYLQAALGAVLLFGFLAVARSRELVSSMRIENSEVLETADLELLAKLSSSKKEATGREILESVRRGHGQEDWSGLQAKLRLFQNLGLAQTRLRVRYGVPTMKWSFRVN